jgi:hypothetical protein
VPGIENMNQPDENILKIEILPLAWPMGRWGVNAPGRMVIIKKLFKIRIFMTEKDKTPVNGEKIPHFHACRFGPGMPGGPIRVRSASF